MQFLIKQLSGLFFLVVLVATIGQAQTQDQLVAAFKESYLAEYKGDFEKAITSIRKLYKEDNYEINLRLGWLTYNQKKYETSLTYYGKAADLKKYSVEARFGYATTAVAANQYAKAYEKYEEILKIDPYNSTANYWVGVNYYSVKKYDIAAKYFELVVNMYPFDYDANHMLAWSYLFLSKPDQARFLFQKTLLIRPEDVSATEGLSKCN